MTPPLVRPVAALLALLATPALAAAPQTLSCTYDASLDWYAATPRIVAADRELGDIILHLRPATGKWLLENEGSAALVTGGGTFEVRRPGFETWYSDWAGVEHDAMLRIHGDTAPYPFVFLSNDQGLVTGHCVEPEETFLLLQEPAT